MKLLVGLGNPDEKYTLTRHNCGWLFLDYISDRFPPDEPWQDKEKFSARVARKGDWWFLKPLTYMNRSGEAVRKFKNFYKIATADLVVIHDDLDLALGSWKLQRGVGPKVHNGLLSLEEELGNKDFWRLRLGVDNRSPSDRSTTPGEDYVLGKFSSTEREQLDATFQPAWTELSKMLG